MIAVCIYSIIIRMSIRVVFFSDTHLGYDFPVRPRLERPRRGPDFFANFQRVLDHASRTRADIVIHGGDFFFRSRLPSLIVDRAYQTLFEFTGNDIPIVIVPGNHERSQLPPSLFLNHPNIHVLDRPRTYRFEIRGESLAVTGFPYLKNVRRGFEAAMSEGDRLQPTDYRLLCVHHAVDGAVVGPGNFTFRGGADVIDQAQLPAGFDAVLAGHVPRRQVLNYDPPVVYCGSIERTSFAEKDEQKGFCELMLHRDTALPEIEFHELPTRPMVEFDGRPYSEPGLLLKAYAVQSARWQPNAVVRICLATYPDKRLSSALTGIGGGSIRLFSVTENDRAALS